MKQPIPPSDEVLCKLEATVRSHWQKIDEIYACFESCETAEHLMQLKATLLADSEVQQIAKIVANDAADAMGYLMHETKRFSNEEYSRISKLWDALAYCDLL